MNPLLVSGVLSLGGKIFNKVFGDSPASKTVKTGFEQQLNKAVGGPEESALLSYLKSQGVSGFDGLKTLDGQLVQQLKAMPGLAEKLSDFGPGDVLNLKITDGNLITLEDENGKIIATITADSAEGAIARRIHQLRLMALEYANQPDQSLVAIANKVSNAETLGSAQWALNPFAG